VKGLAIFANINLRRIAANSATSKLARRASIGMVGPMSNYAAPPQLVESVPYRNMEQMQEFAGRWREEHRGQWFTVGKLSGFCLLMKRAVYEAIGGLDEQFGLGLFDDDDLAVRALSAGFELAVAHDLFVHHFGSRTFAGNRIDTERLLDDNARLFAGKWGDAVARGHRVMLRPWTADPGSHAAIGRNQNTGAHAKSQRRKKEVGSARDTLPQKPLPKANVSLTIIARDEATNLSNCLRSVQGLFDEIVVVDTGSTDRTVEVARSFGARVFDFVWVDDFAAARNAALARAAGDYAFWLDADDVVDPPERDTLRTLIDGLRAAEPSAYVVRCQCDPGEDGSGGETVVDHIRLFPLREEVRWTYRVHE
jgi:GT2 family glycosyltransferase